MLWRGKWVGCGTPPPISIESYDTIYTCRGSCDSKSIAARPKKIKKMGGVSESFEIARRSFFLKKSFISKLAETTPIFFLIFGRSMVDFESHDPRQVYMVSYDLAEIIRLRLSVSRDGVIVRGWEWCRYFKSDVSESNDVLMSSQLCRHIEIGRISLMRRR